MDHCPLMSLRFMLIHYEVIINYNLFTEIVVYMFYRIEVSTIHYEIKNTYFIVDYQKLSEINNVYKSQIHQNA